MMFAERALGVSHYVACCRTYAVWFLCQLLPLRPSRVHGVGEAEKRQGVPWPLADHHGVAGGVASHGVILHPQDGSLAAGCLVTLSPGRVAFVNVVMFLPGVRFHGGLP